MLVRLLTCAQCRYFCRLVAAHLRGARAQRLALLFFPAPGDDQVALDSRLACSLSLSQTSKRRRIRRAWWDARKPTFEASSPIRVLCQAAWAPASMVPSIACILVNHCMHKISTRPLSILISAQRHDAKVKARSVSERQLFPKDDGGMAEACHVWSKEVNSWRRVSCRTIPVSLPRPSCAKLAPHAPDLGLRSLAVFYSIRYHHHLCCDDDAAVRPWPPHP